MTALLEVRGITKHFAGITALDDVSLEVGQGELVGLIGPNGAGKTTLFNCVLGVLRADGGSVLFAGRDLGGIPVHRRARLGIGRTFQRIELFAGMTPREHLLVAERVRRGSGGLIKDVLGLGRATDAERTKAQTTLDLLGLADHPDRPIESLSLGRGRLVEVGRALMIDPYLLLLDEPSSGLDRAETRTLAETLRHVHRERGTAVLLVEHDIEMVEALVERVSVLDFGTLLTAGPTDEVLASDVVRQAYLGTAHGDDRP